ncbi:MAG: DDE-type integrase/transposase/recombinase [Desulfovibrionaceae bacterium]|nr:DDE-type integrase/transposase/recombinase [Desulfovibrionaceae bacterium]
MPSTPSTEQLRLISDAARALEKADPCNGDRGRIVARLAETLGRSLNTTYQYLKKYGGWESGKKPRKGKGETCVPEALCRKIAGLVICGDRANGKRPMCIKDAVKRWEANGEGIADPETGEVTMPSVETISRAMRRYGCHPDQLRVASPSVRMRTEYPNRLWQADASVCVLYRIRGTGNIGLMKEESYNEKKPENLIKIRNTRIVRYIVVDHCSGNFYLRYEQAAGEDAKGFLDTLIDAITDRGPQDVMHGVPEILYTDPGPGPASSLVTGFCGQMGITPAQHVPGRARATGSVEKCQDIVECKFESRLRFLEVPDVAQLQALADRWRRYFCATAIHTRTKKTRNDVWLSIPAEKLRTAEADVMHSIAAWGEVRCQVKDDFTISADTRTHYGVRRYDLRELGYHGLQVRDSVSVRLNPYKAPSIIAVIEKPDGEKVSFEVPPMQFDGAGFDLGAPAFGEGFKAMPKTRAEKNLEAIKKEAYGVQSVEEADKMRRAGKPAYAGIDIMADVKEAPVYLKKAGTPLPLEEKKADVPPMKRLSFALMMRRDHPDVWRDDNTDECAEWLRTRYPDTVPGNEIEAVIERMREKFAPKRARRLEFRPNEGRAACAG